MTLTAFKRLLPLSTIKQWVLLAVLLVCTPAIFAIDVWRHLWVI